MLVADFFRWWYTAGWKHLLTEVKQRLVRLGQTFSVLLLLRTLFKPWKQIVALKDPNATLGMRARGLLDNLVSRFVGLMVRLLTLVIGAMSIVGLGIVGLGIILIWPLMPLLTLGLMILSTGVI